MLYTLLVIGAAALVAGSPSSAQTGAKKTPEQIKASYESHKGDFDYLLGDWEFTAVSQQVRQVPRTLERHTPGRRPDPGRVSSGRRQG